MKNKKGLALLLSAALLFTTAMPGTLAISSSTASSATTLTTASEPDAAPDAPDAATAPDTTSAPDTTTAPDATATPDATSTPDATVAPDSTAAPENDTTPAPDSTFDVAAAYEYVMGLASDEEVDTYLASLTEDEYAALEAYAVEKEQENAPVIESKVFTDAGPFLPAVNVGSQIIKPRRAARTLAAAEEPARVDNDGIITSKTVTSQKDENGNTTYTLRLESYVTGTTTTTTTTTSIPVDIVLVLDQSGSMADNFEGESTNNDSERRQHALKLAVNNFIDKVADKYSDDCDNRMAIVTYGTNATIMRGWTVVNEESKESLKNGDSSSRNVIDGINKLPDEPSGATNTAAGVQMAEVLLSDTSKKVNVHTAETDYWGDVTRTYDTSYDGQYTYSGQNTNRQKVVIVFTDGVPTMATDFDTTVATKAIASAKNLKDAGVGATIYSVGIFNGVKPEQMYGAEGFSKNSDGSIGSNWSDFSFWMIGDIQSYDIPAGNRFLNLLSSNFKDADEIGIEKYKKTIIGIGYRGWEITKNFDRTASNYYLTASDSDSLSEIFTTISQNIQTGSASVQLGSETKVQDVISDYFELPAGANPSSISVKTALYNQDSTWGADQSSTLTAKISGKTITVTGFDFSQNYCDTTKGRVDGNNDKEGDFYGRKLIIEIPIVVRDGFLGGNDVPTNTTDSKIIASNGTVMEQFEVPTTNVEIATPQFNTNSVTIYEGNSVETKSLYTLPSFNDEDDWKDDYVTINGSESQNVTPTDCTEYTVTVTYTPTSQGNSNSFAPVSANSNTGTATVHVLKPTVTATVNDVQKYYGETYTLGEGTNGSINVTWTDKTAGHTATIESAIGTAPYGASDLALAYSADSFNGTIGKSNFDVTVKVMKGEVKMANAVIITNCSYGCADGATDGKYTVHVNTCSLTITKLNGAVNEPYVFNVLKDGKKYTEVTIVPNSNGQNSSVTIYELPVGKYTIEEDTGWSWRYTPEYSQDEDVALSKDKPNGNITCTNKRTGYYWLNGYSGVETNVYGEAHQASNN